jgi:4'-phosphopantetheinyl transferase
MTAQSWQSAARQQPPAPGEIHVWRIDLACAASPDPVSLHSPDERERAAHLLIDNKRVRFVAGRAALRRVLGQYLGVAPRSLVLTYGAHGKPALDHGEMAAGLAFNFSNSENLALLAVGYAPALGIDTEHRGRHISEAPFAHHILSESEAAELARFPAGQRTAALLSAWTRKEAGLKALGVGLLRPMCGFTTGFGSEREAVVRRLEDADGKRQRWSLIALDAHADYHACLAAPGEDWTVRCFDWRPAN